MTGTTETALKGPKGYQYLQEGKEVSVGLDFGEILSLEVLYDGEEEGTSKLLLSEQFESRKELA